ncbi:hypothetical protein JX266_013863 [Neoarthrinium moseri]|nr:hypothetical protein JX266_013863 [Neoarthrinium moseri]
MRLLQLGAAGKLVLAMDMAQNYYPYAILSHTWRSDDEEVKLQDLYIASRVGWFRRGWTLQELLVPQSVEFFSAEDQRLGDKKSLVRLVHSITRISPNALQGRPMCEFDTLERMSWLAKRQTQHEEDLAYCMLDIFGVQMPLLYGEGGDRAQVRLRETIAKWSGASRSGLPLPGRQSAVPPDPHFIIPFGRNADFVGRRDLIEQLVGQVHPSANDDACQKTVVEGLGGVGKTQLALEVAYRIRRESPACSVFWVSAVNAATLENGYRDIGSALELPGLDDDKADVKGLVKAALGKCPGSWLLIIDNADDVDLLFGDDGVNLRGCLPSSPHGSVLLTTRFHQVAVELDVPTRNILRIAEMSEDEAIEMLQTALSDKQMRDTTSTKSLLALLMCLPLAVKQAMAYMKQTSVSTTRYLENCRRSNKDQIKLLSRDFEDSSRYRDIANPITTTWLISFQHIEMKCHLAARYLKSLCFLAEKDILLSLLPDGADEMEKDEAVGILVGYAFITEREEDKSFDMHRLVRLATRNWLADTRANYFTEMAQQLARIYPWPQHENRSVWVRYMPHAEAILADETECTDLEAYGDLLSAVGNSYDMLGKYEEAETMHRKEFGLCKRVLGPEHPSTLSSMNNLACVLDSQGKYEEAETMHRKTLELREEVFGPEHPSTLDSMNNLANVLDSQGKYEEAETMHRKTLELREEVLGPEHPNTLAIEQRRKTEQESLQDSQLHSDVEQNPVNTGGEDTAAQQMKTARGMRRLATKLYTFRKK